MKRTMFQLYLKDCDGAIEFYKKAFDATVDAVHRDSQTNAIMHAEIRAFGQCIAFSEREDSTSIAGNTMQFCFHFGEGNEKVVEKAYNVLKDGAHIDYPLGTIEWSPLMFSLVDKYGVNWCLFV
ncbi:MAG: VOC family protein [Oscillospiraceae bacterium]|nr:VOC family protein [Oscillospiraceae bacterium]